ncbi:hypothetical protein D3C71_2132460 [compost metagenome]
MKRLEVLAIRRMAGIGGAGETGIDSRHIDENGSEAEFVAELAQLDLHCLAQLLVEGHERFIE